MSFTPTNLSTTPSVKPATNYRYWMIFLVCMGMVINYVDRVNFGVAAPSIMKEFQMSASSMGVLMSAFFIPYTLMMLPTGYLLNKYGPKKIFGYALIGWGAATMGTSLVSGFRSLLVTRVFMGLTEAPGFPCCTRVVSAWFPPQERTFASAAFDCCARIGTAFAPPLVAAIIVAWGWRSSFVLTGALAIVWGAVWFFWYKEPDEHPKVSESELQYIRQHAVPAASQAAVKPIPISRLFTYGTLMRAALGFSLYMYVWNVFAYWLPAYFLMAKGFSMTAMGIAAMIPQIVAVFCELLGGALFDKWYRAGASLNMVRRTGMAICMLGSAVFIYAAMQASDPFWIVFYLSCFSGVSGFGGSNVQAIPSDFAPPGQAGGVSAVYVFTGNCGSFFAPMITGFIVDTKYGYEGAFLFAAALCVVSALFYIFNSYDQLKPKEA